MLGRHFARVLLAGSLLVPACSGGDDDGTKKQPAVDSGTDAPDSSVGNPADPFVDGLAAKPTVLYFGAHPDDEFSTSALLGELVERGAKLHLVVATYGEKTTTCFREQPCTDVKAIRQQELQTSVDGLGGGEIQYLDIPDGAAGSDPNSDPRPTVAAWTSLRPSLVDDLKTIINSLKPVVIFTFDPREGISCHPDHRAAGYFLVKALVELGADAPEAFFVASKRNIPFGFTPPTENPAVELFEYDAKRTSARLGGDMWGYHAVVASAHKSQFQTKFVDSIATTPPEQRMGYYLPIKGYPAKDPDFDRCYVPFGHGPVEAENDGGGGDAATSDGGGDSSADAGSTTDSASD